MTYYTSTIGNSLLLPFLLCILTGANRFAIQMPMLFMRLHLALLFLNQNCMFFCSSLGNFCL